MGSMDEFAALAARIVEAVDDARGCLIVSRDAMVLAAYPAKSETEITGSLTRFLSLGPATRGFVELEEEIWCHVRHDSCSAFVVTGPAARPGLVIAQLDRALDRFDDAERLARPTEGRHEPAPRLPASDRSTVPTVVIEHREPRSSAAPSAAGDRHLMLPDVDAPPPPPSPASGEGDGVRAGHPVAGPARASEPPPKPPSSEPEVPESDRVGRPTEEEDDVDQAEIAREFAGLLQDPGGLADW
jgi:hypothetical protein